jgi:hypothetical protein
MARRALPDPFEWDGQAMFRRSRGLRDLFFEIGVIVDSHQGSTARGNGFFPRRPALPDGLLNRARRQRSRITAFGLYLLEELPGFPRQRIRESFDVVGTSRGISHRIQVRFLLEDVLHVDGEMRVESERFHHQAVATPGCCRKRLRAHSQQIGIAVVDALIAARGAGLQVHHAGVPISRPECRHGLRPQQPRRTQLGNF